MQNLFLRENLLGMLNAEYITYGST